MAITQPTQTQTYYKPQPGQPGYDVNNPQAVYDASGNIVSLQQYKQATGQTDIADPSKINWDAVQSGVPTNGFGNSTTFDPNSLPGLSAVWGTLSPAEQAFVQSAYGVVKGQYNAGGVATADINTWNKALQIASNDPTIKAQYGDAATEGAQALAASLGQLTGDYNAQQTATLAAQQQQQGQLNQQVQQAGQAYSSFRQQAQNQLNAQQNQVIQSSRSTLAKNIQQLGSGYESQFGSQAAQAQPISVGGVSYNPIGNIIGTNTQNQLNAETTTAVQQGILPSASRTTGQVSTTGQ